MYTWPTTTTSASNTCDGLHLHKDGVRVFSKTLKDAALGRSPASPRHLLPTPQYHRPIHPYMPRHPPPAPVRTNTTRHPPHPPKAPYTPVNLLSLTSHPPAAHQTPVRKKKPRATPLQEKPPQLRAQMWPLLHPAPPPPPPPPPPTCQRTEPDQRDAADTVQPAPQQTRTIYTNTVH